MSLRLHPVDQRPGRPFYFRAEASKLQPIEHPTYIRQRTFFKYLSLSYIDRTAEGVHYKLFVVSGFSRLNIARISKHAAFSGQSPGIITSIGPLYPPPKAEPRRKRRYAKWV
jgi:hypothetical protein